jgi:uncharacterized membrane protein
MAELSNPFLIIRTALKIRKEKNSTFYAVNDIIFAVVFLIVRVILTPIMMISFYEAENCIYSTKLLTALVFFVQMFWAYRILQLICEKVKSSYIAKK